MGYTWEKHFIRRRFHSYVYKRQYCNNQISLKCANELKMASFNYKFFEPITNRQSFPLWIVQVDLSMEV